MGRAHHAIDYIEFMVTDLAATRAYAGIQGPDGPLVLLYSDDLDATVTAGGQVVAPPYEFPGGRRFQFTDPSGNELGPGLPADREQVSK